MRPASSSRQRVPEPEAQGLETPLPQRPVRAAAPRVAVVCSELHLSYGGPAQVVRRHAAALRNRADVTIYGAAEPAHMADIVRDLPGARLFPAARPRRWFRGRGLRQALEREAAGFDVLHAHMFWEHGVWAAWRAARLARRPLVVTPHGAVSDPWRLRGLHKILYGRLVATRILADVAALHVFTRHEEEAFRQYGYRGRIAVIPNGLPASEFSKEADRRTALDTWPALRGRRVLLYLGRYWSGKGLDILPGAWADAGAGKGDWILVLAGPDYRGWQAEMEAEVGRLGIGGSVLITGPVRGPLKDSLLAASDCIVLPSHGEGFSMSLLEAMAAGRPTLYTRPCRLPELAEAGGGWCVDDSREALAGALGVLFGLAIAQLRQAGAAARALGRERFTMECIADRLVALYRELGKR